MMAIDCETFNAGIRDRDARIKSAKTVPRRRAMLHGAEALGLGVQRLGSRFKSRGISGLTGSWL